MHSDGRFKYEDEYEIIKVRKAIRTHVFKHVKFYKGEGNKSPANSFEKKNAKILQYSKCHEKANLSKRVECDYNIIKLVGFDENTRSLIDREF